MTMKQVRAAPGMKWKERVGHLDSVGEVLVGGAAYSLSIYFRNGKASSFRLGGSPLDCEAKFDSALRVLERRYGVFVPLLRVRKGVTWSALGRSKYSEMASVRPLESFVFDPQGANHARVRSRGAWRLSGDRLVKLFAERQQRFRILTGEDFQRPTCMIMIDVSAGVDAALYDPSYNVPPAAPH
ncbi:MAG: hypothetical protein SGI91_08135 [Alphaproteobacteria bacterium]|nr:hypothetical protein [Alphaproteobacteria bacterium]